MKKSGFNLIKQAPINDNYRIMIKNECNLKWPEGDHEIRWDRMGGVAVELLNAILSSKSGLIELKSFVKGLKKKGYSDLVIYTGILRPIDIGLICRCYSSKGIHAVINPDGPQLQNAGQLLGLMTDFNYPEVPFTVFENQQEVTKYASTKRLL